MAQINSCCTCFGNTVTLNPCNNPTSGCGDCLTLGHIVVGCENSIAPCDVENTLKVPFDCFCFPCQTPEFKILNTNSIKYATVVSIDKTGLVIRPDGTGVANSKVEVNFKAKCGEGCDVKTDYGSVTIYLKDLCKGAFCGDSEICNECTGECDDVPGDLSTSGGSVSIIGGLSTNQTLKEI